MTPAHRPAWDLTPAILGELGYPRDPAHLFGRLQRVATWDARGPVLAAPGRAFVDDARLDLALPRIAAAVPSSDGATRLVLELDGGARIEAVHMPRAVRGARTTVCLSSQVGCAMGCTFCATAEMGLVRSLQPHEIVGQLLAVMHALGPASAERLNLVFMGMGEPLHDVEALVRALDVLCDPAGLGVAPSRITVSTAGHVSGIARLAEARYRPELAVSVTTAIAATRRRLMPIEKKWPLPALREALERWPKRPHEKIVLEVVLLDGENDDVEHAERLADFASGLRALINVIPWNAWTSAGEPGRYREPSPERVTRFVETLRARGALVKVRRNRARDAKGACGTLATERLVR